MKSASTGPKYKHPMLGIWDGHDCGAALVDEGRIVFAVNEERLSRRKLEIGFPVKSIEEVLDYTGLKPRDIEKVAVSTSDFSKTLTRVFPSLRESYYLIRRRKKTPGIFTSIKKRAKYCLTELPPSLPTKLISRMVVRRELSRLGFGDVPVELVDHHAAHAAAAAFCSGMEEALVLTIDGIGDGLSGSIWNFSNGDLKLLSTISGKTSFGIFFEHITNLMNMRELEDEGKVMALANYAYPIPDDQNPLLKLFKIDGMQVKASCSTGRMHKVLSKILWQYPSEQFAYMAQRVLELKITELIKNCIEQTGTKSICYSGGVASNIKVNMLIQELSGVEKLYVFPHMGDGGLALGAALWANYKDRKISSYALPNVCLGRAYGNQEIESAAKDFPGLKLDKCPKPSERAASLLNQGEILMWFQGRMEYGPRSLGARSILASPNSEEIRDLLNLKLKKRVWYQPFCPSMLHDDAKILLQNYTGPPNPFMTSAYRTHPDKCPLIKGVLNIDGSCRPQILTGRENTRYCNLLRKVKDLSGIGVVLNTSFNQHGQPIVNSPQDALRTFQDTDINYMIIEDYLVTKV